MGLHSRIEFIFKSNTKFCLDPGMVNLFAIDLHSNDISKQQMRAGGRLEYRALNIFPIRALLQLWVR